MTRRALTVVIAAYDAADTIADAVASARAAGADRVLVVDDGSRDRTSDVAAAAGARVLRQSNAGAARAREAGALAVDTELLAFLDADDVLVPAGVRASVRMLSADEGLVAVGGRVQGRTADGALRLLPRHYPEVTLAAMLQRGFGPWPPAAQVIRTAAYRRAGELPVPPLRPPFAEDYELVLRLASVGRIGQHDEVSCQYTLFAGKASRHPLRALRCKEQIRAHYSRHSGIPIAPMTPVRALVGAALIRGRALAMRRRASRSSRAGSVEVAGRPGVLVVTPWLEGGGAQSALVGLLQRLPREHVHVVALFAGCAHTEPVRQAAGRYTELDLPRNPVGALRAARWLAGHQAGYRTVYSLMRGSHVAIGLMPNAAALRDRLAVTFHQLPSEDDRDVASRLENVLVRRALRHASLVTAPTPRACAELVRHRMAPASKVVHDPNLAVRRDVTPPLPPAPGGDEVRLFFAGRLTAQKGLDLLAATLAHCPQRVHLRIAGDGPELAHLQALYGALPHHRAEFLGRVDDVTEHLDWSHAAVMPSRFELTPVFITEAWARGRMVIGTPLPVFEDLSARGPLVMYRDDEQFAQIVTEVLNDPGYLSNMFEKARAVMQSSDDASALVRYLTPGDEGTEQPAAA
jgi:glycosyltransferase involved in cell wall biosynthesis